MIMFPDQAQLELAAVILDTIDQTRQSLEGDTDPSFATAIGIFFKLKLRRGKHGTLFFRFKSKLFHSIEQLKSIYFFPDEGNRSRKAVIYQIASIIALTEYAEEGSAKFIFAKRSRPESNRFFLTDLPMHPFSNN